MDLETLLLHADADTDADTGTETEAGIAPSIAAATAFAATSAEEFDDMSQRPRHDRFYRRHGNPTQSRLERVMAQIEGAESALATGSGMGAISTTLLSLLSQGDHVVAQKSMYGGSLSLLQSLLPRLGIEATLVEQGDPEAFARAITPRTALVMLESPSNPLLQLTDLAAVAELARERGITTLADNTVATPVVQRPHERGVDLVVHSATKALSGHSDALAGIVTGTRELIGRIWETHIVLGAVISPFDAWLALRGLRTLAMRVRSQNDTALAVARALADHPAVETVNYPGLEAHPQHGLALRQMEGFGGLLSFELRGGRDAAESMLAALRIPARSTSLGSAHSLVVRPAAMWAHDLSPEQIENAAVPPGLVRLSVGLEAKTDLIADVQRALAGL